MGEKIAKSIDKEDEAVRRMHSLTGISLPEILQMASLTPARAIGLEGEIGSIKEGMKADFVLFDDDLQLHNVIIQGNLIVAH